MALQKQLVQVDLGPGLDQHHDPKSLQPGQLTTADNIQYTKDNRLSKRYGSSPVGATNQTLARIFAIGNDVIAATPISTAAWQLVTRNAAAASGWNSPRTASSAAKAIPDVLPAPRVTVDMLPQVVATLDDGYYHGVDSAIGQKHIFVLKFSSSWTVISAYDKITGSFVASTLIAVGGYYPMRLVASLGAPGCVLCVGAPTLPIYLRKWDPATGAVTILTSAGLQAPLIDAEWIDTGGAGAIAVAASQGGLSVWLWDFATGALINSTTIALTGALLAVSIAKPAAGSSKIRVFFTDSGAGISAVYYSLSLNVVQAKFVVDSAASAKSASSIVAVENPSLANVFVAAEYPPSATPNAAVLRYLVANGTVTTTYLTMLACGLASKAVWPATSSAPFYWMVYATTTQNTLFLAYGINVVGRAAHQLAQGLSGSNAVPNAWYLATRGVGAFPGVVSSVINILVGASINGVTNGTEFRPAILDVGVNPSSGVIASNIHGTPCLTGGLLAVVDKAMRVVEAGPLLYPEIVSLAAAGTGTKSAGTYSVVCVYERIDASGMLVRGQISPPLSVTLTGGVGSNAITVVAQNPRVTMLDQSADDASQPWWNIAAYVTGANGTLYRRETSVSASPQVQSTTITLNNSDATNLTKAALYTTGGFAENYWPSCPIALWQNGKRAYAVAGDNPCFVMEGQPFDPALGVSFFRSIGKYVDPGGPPIMGGTSFFDRHIVWKERSTWIASGDGADLSGANDTLSDFAQLSGDVGLESPGAFVATREMVIFKSKKGFWAIGRDMSLSYIGSFVDDLANGNYVTSAYYVEERDEARFLMSDSTEIVYNVHHQRWTRFTFIGATIVDGCVSNGVRYLAMSAGGATSNVEAENTATFLDNNRASTGVQSIIETGWIKPAGLAGFVRCWSIYVLGESKSPHTCQVELAYDYGGYTETRTITSANATIAGTAYLFRVRLANQRFSAVRFRIRDLSPVGESMNLNGLMLECGVMEGGARLRADKTA